METISSISVWGITVPIDAYGKRLWPDTVKAQAVERIAAGTKVRAIATEIGATNGLVSKWVQKGRKQPSAQKFVDVTMAEAPAAIEPSDSCRILIGDTTLSVPPGFPPQHLTELLRAVRASQC